MRTAVADLRILNRAECLQLLRSTTVGRIAVTNGLQTIVLPVRFHIDDDDRIVITTRPRQHGLPGNR